MLQIKDLTFDAYGRRFFDEASVSLPVGAKVRFGATPTGVLRGFVKTANGYVPIYSQ